MRNETKLKKLMSWLDDNSITYRVPNSSVMGRKGASNLIIYPAGKLRIHVKIEGSDDSIFYERRKGFNPVFIRNSDTPKFVLEKVQNVIISLMQKQNAYEQLSKDERAKVKKRSEKRKEKLRKKELQSKTKERDSVFFKY